jgi:REP element-mobilizing transposase RayT
LFDNGKWLYLEENYLKIKKTMADVFSQLYIQTVFAVKNRQALIRPEWEENLYRYTTGVIETRGHKMLAIGGMPDHIHIFFGLKPAESISDLVREIKTATNDYIKEQGFSPNKFDWQAGYGAFSYSRSHMDAVYKYILNQKEHHKKRTFEQEFFKILEDFEVEIGKKKMFDFFLPD